MKRLVFVILGGILFLAGCQNLDAVQPNGAPALKANPESIYLATARWTPPITGVVEYYHLRVINRRGNENYTSIPDTFCTIAYHPGDRIKVKVRGIDAQGRAGPWSDRSDEFFIEKKPDDPPEYHELPGKPGVAH